MKVLRIVQDTVRDFVVDKIVTAICAAPSIIADLGLPDGKQATCNPNYENQMHEAILPNESVVVDGNIITD